MRLVGDSRPRNGRIPKGFGHVATTSEVVDNSGVMIRLGSASDESTYPFLMYVEKAVISGFGKSLLLGKVDHE